MQRRDFLYRSTLGVAGLLAAQSVLGHPPGLCSPATDLAIFFPDSRPDHPAVAGAVRMLQDSCRPFDLLHEPDELVRYRLILLPDQVCLSPSQAARLEAYLDQGGAVLASHQSGLTPEGFSFASRRFGLRLMGRARYSPDFLTLSPGFLSRNLSDAELLMYLRGTEVQSAGAAVLAWTQSPYTLTDRSVSLYGYPGITYHENVLYFMHPVFTQYAHSAPRWCKQLVKNSLDYLLEKSTLPVLQS